MEPAVALFDEVGDGAPYTNTCTQNTYKFEGKERDTETGNDDFGARYYSNRFGRWLSADWSSVPVPVPYANLTNPQTLNLYSMVADDPESFADLDGHQNGNPSPVVCSPDGCAYTTDQGPKDAAQAAQPQNQPPEQPQNQERNQQNQNQNQQPNQPPPTAAMAAPGKLPPSANPAQQAARQATRGNPKVTPNQPKVEVRPGTSNPQKPVENMIKEVTGRPEAQRVKGIVKVLQYLQGVFTGFVDGGTHVSLPFFIDVRPDRYKPTEM